MIAIIAISCKPKELIRYVEIPVVTTKIDSVKYFQKDSIILFQRGDTVFKEKYKTIYKDRVKLRTDTVSIPIKVNVPVDRVVTKSRNVYGIFWWGGLIAAIYLLISAVIRIKKIFI